MNAIANILMGAGAGVSLLGLWGAIDAYIHSRQIKQRMLQRTQQTPIQAFLVRQQVFLMYGISRPDPVIKYRYDDPFSQAIADLLRPLMEY